MRPRHRVSRTAIELIKRFEGYREKAAQLPDGRWTIGYGHTLTAREGAQVSEDDAEALLIYDLIAVAHTINETVFSPLTQNQFDALCSFCFNLGPDNFRRSQVLKRLNEGAMLQAACAMELWRRADVNGERILVDALVRRRASEKALFLTPPGDAWVPAPSPVLRPAVDLDARELIPRHEPAAVLTSMEGETVLVTREGEPPPPPAPPTGEEGEEAPGSAVRAAAESVTVRLAAIFPDPGEEPAPEAPAEAEAAEIRPQADFAPPVDIVPGPAAAPEPAAASEDAVQTAADEPVVLTYPEPQAANDPPPAPEFQPEPEPRAAQRVLIDDHAVHEFIPARVQPLPRRKEGGLITDVVLALLGLAFFGFGLFWGLNARTDPGGGFANPLLVAWLAGVAGVGFIVVAVFRLLERLARASERG